MAETIVSGRTTYLHVDGFLYYKHSNGSGDVRYWRCRNQHECSARATTTGHDLNITVTRRTDHSRHPPDREEVAALKLIGGLKRKATDDVSAPPVQLLRELQNAPAAVLAQLPYRQNLTKRIQRERLKGMPTNPRNVDDLRNIPGMYRATLDGENFLLYDSYNDATDVSDDDDSTSEETNLGRILIFATKANLQALAKSEIWFVDGTFKTSPAIFYQLFVIKGSVSHVVDGIQQVSIFPFVYALMENKREAGYTEVLEVVIHAIADAGAHFTPPQRVMSDFELAIVNACKKSLGDVISCCLFHLCQNIFRKIQSAGLQGRYNDEEDRSIKQAAQMMGALAFVPTADVLGAFDTFVRQIPTDFLPVAQYFEVSNPPACALVCSFTNHL